MKMARKQKGSGLKGEDVLVGIMISVASGAAVFFLALGVVGFASGRQETMEQPPAPSHTARVTLPSSNPEPTQKPVVESLEPSTEPEQNTEPVQQTEVPKEQPTQAPATTQDPAQTQTPTQTQAPTATKTPAPTKNPGPIVSISPTMPPAQQTKAPQQSSGQGGNGAWDTSNGDGTYTHDFSGGRVLATTQSNNGGNPVYHIKDCQAARKIPPENVCWYDSAQAAINDGRNLCGYCGR